jgi:hypothetical protein
MNSKQRENTAKLLLDLIKILVTVFVVGGLVPNSPIGGWQVVGSLMVSLLIYAGAMYLLRGE